MQQRTPFTLGFKLRLSTLSLLAADTPYEVILLFSLPAIYANYPAEATSLNICSIEATDTNFDGSGTTTI
jgi:hypothetical protein